MCMDKPHNTIMARPSCHPKASPDQCVQVPMPTHSKAMGENTITAQARSNAPV